MAGYRTAEHGLTPASFFYLKRIVDGVVTYALDGDNKARALLRRGLITKSGPRVSATPAGVALVTTYRTDNNPGEH